MEKPEQKVNYIYIALGVVAIIAMSLWAYMNGLRDGARHNDNRTTQNANANR